MARTFEWLDRGAERVLYLDDPDASPAPRFVAARPRAGEEGDWWTVATRLDPGGPEEVEDFALADARVAQDAALKLAVQALARRHGVSPSPGEPSEEAPEAERLIARLWRALAELHGGP